MTRAWRVRDASVDLGRVAIMGILNVTPDSFSDGGRFLDPDAAVKRGLQIAAEGADIIDVGGESTRPGAAPIAVDKELRRIVPVVASLAEATDVPVSIDTRRAAVARAALGAGARIVNDVSAGRHDPDMLGLVADAGAGLVLMHMQGEPATMQGDPRYGDVVAEVETFLLERAAAAMRAGVARDAVVIDPGLGFGKTAVHNLALVRALPRLTGHGFPVLLGHSRKSLLGAMTGRPLAGRLAGGLALATYAALHGASVLRVHDVAEARDALAVVRAVQEGA